jgi:hypothetical protein
MYTRVCQYRNSTASKHEKSKKFVERLRDRVTFYCVTLDFFTQIKMPYYSLLFRISFEKNDWNVDLTVLISVVEPHHFYAAPAPGKNFALLGELALSCNVATDRLVY